MKILFVKFDSEWKYSVVKGQSDGAYIEENVV
jgi:hypothetical protein